MTNLTAWFLPRLVEEMRSLIEHDIPFDSVPQVYTKILSHQYVIEVEQFGVTEQYSTCDYRQALEFIDNFDRENKDIIIRTYDLTTYNYEDNRFEPIF
jgi:hypothetical protein